MNIFVFLVLPIFLGLALARPIPKIDPTKFTICTVTINSDNERAVFEQEVKKNPKKFNPIVELTNFDEKDWFNKSCESGLRCDQLVISGHFGGTFFGSSGKSLPLTVLENRGCSNTCNGILSHPYEVFLFGCNTLSTREKDHRTPQQYLQVLLADGIPQREAELVVESRYGNIGDDHRSKMQRAFAGEKKQLYGFYSVGPSGKNVEGFLKNYFKKVNLADRLEKLLAKRMMDKADFMNTELAEALKVTAFAQCDTGNLVNDEKTRIICGLRDSSRSVDDKLTLVMESLSNENYLTYIPSINEFLRSNPVDQMSDQQKSVIDEIKGNPVIKGQILSLAKNTKSLILANEWVLFGSNFDFIDDREAEAIFAPKVKEIFSKPVTIDEKDILCSLDRTLLDKVDFQLKDWKTKDFGQIEYGAMACLKPKNRDVILRVIKGLLIPDQVENDVTYNVSQSALQAFIAIDPQDEDLQLQFLDTAFKSSDTVIRILAIQAFNKIKPLGSRVWNKLLEGLKDPETYCQFITVKSLYDMQIDIPVEVQLKLAEHLDKPYLADDISEGFQKKKPTDSQVLDKIKELNPELWKMLIKH